MKQYLFSSTITIFHASDVKPCNILVKADDENLDLKTVHMSKLTFVLCDFGLARYMYNNANSTMSLTTVGTFEYVPPEARDDHKDENPSSHYKASFDTFSAGVVTHELITGELHKGFFLENIT